MSHGPKQVINGTNVTMMFHQVHIAHPKTFDRYKDALMFKKIMQRLLDQGSTYGFS